MISPAQPLGTVYSVTWPVGVSLHMLPDCPVYQRFPSGPAVICRAALKGPVSSIANSVISSAVVILPMRLVELSTNQMVPCGPVVIPIG